MKLLRFILHKIGERDEVQDLAHLLLLLVVIVGFLIIWLRDKCRLLVREYRAFQP